jgi:hypothetical protein
MIPSGGRTRTRTLDPLIKSQLLYQLSYAPGMPALDRWSKAALDRTATLPYWFDA